MKIALISDAWKPQVNGVVTTVTNTRQALQKQGHVVKLITPDLFKTYPCAGYPQVRLAFLCGPKMRPILQAFQPDAIHIFTEGPVGYAVRRYCRAYHYRYTTSFHSRFAEYFKLRNGFPAWISSTYLRWFHSQSEAVMVSTQSLAEELSDQGYQRLKLWSRGVNSALFKPGDKGFLDDQRPIFFFTGRVAIEKNIEDFLQLDLPGTRYIIGDGPQRKELQQKYPKARFIGYKQNQTLAQYMAAADVMVFPSRTDTFGIAMLEALACGIPVAAYPVKGPADVIQDQRVGILSDDLRQAAMQALALNPDHCRDYALQFTWEKCTRQFVGNLCSNRHPRA